MRLDSALTPKGFLKASAEAFYLEVGDYTGAMLDFRGAVEYKAFKNVDFGLGFDLLNVRVEADASNEALDLDFNGELNFDYAGLQAYAKFYL